MMELIISLTALFVAIGSMYFAWQQVRLAKQTKTETEKLLKEIDLKVRELKSLTRTIKQNVEDTIRDMISNSNENFIKLLDKMPAQTIVKDEAPKTQTTESSGQDKLMEALLPGILEKAMDDPDNFDKFIQKMEKIGKK